MGLFDLAAPLFSAVDTLLAHMLPSLTRLLLWGVMAGLITMLAYRKLSNQKKIGVLKEQQKVQQKRIAEFDGEFEDLMPLIRNTLAIGIRQLGLALGPALLATLPVLFVVIWVAGQFANEAPAAGTAVMITAQPGTAENLEWEPQSAAAATETGWLVNWPDASHSIQLLNNNEVVLSLPLDRQIPIIHQKRWWNVLMANPIGYLPEDLEMDTLEIDLPKQQLLGFGPSWMRGWMFSFFTMFLVSSLAFKFLFRIH